MTEESWFDPGGAKKCFFYPKYRDGIWLFLTALSLDKGGFFPVLQQPEREADPESRLG
jgi:hypothetical protein